MDFTGVDSFVHSHLDKTFPAAQVEIRVRGETVYACAFGFLDPESRLAPTKAETRFDLASVSKLFTVTAFMSLVEQGLVSLDQRVCTVLPQFVGERPITRYPDPLNPDNFVSVVAAQDLVANANLVTFRNLLSHNSGLPAWLPLWKSETRESRRDAALSAAFAYPTGTRVVYSDIGLILLGFAMEKITAQSLDQIVHERVSVPLGLGSIGYGPISCKNVAPTEYYTHQQRRMCGEVHDENAWSLGGVAGHAGVFGCAHDAATLGEMYRRGGAPVLSHATVAEMTKLQAQDGAIRRGVGFALWSPDPGAASNPLSQEAFGHLGFTGTSLWIDPAHELVCACLTNRVFYGRGNADAIGAFRVLLHKEICRGLAA